MEKSLIEVFNRSFEEIKKIAEKGKIKKYVEFKENKIFTFYFNERIEIDLKSGKFYPNIDDREKVLILHYLSKECKTNPNGIITFKDLPEGTFYFPSIYSRIHKPLIEKYGKRPDDFVEKMVGIGGTKISDYSVRINIFPDIFFIFEILPEDQEFPADLKVFFNKTSSKIFEIEDLAIIGEIVVSKIL
ncbi:MAG: DUF3786 domain-containing protein [Candidatus Omnitrophica bacterium]|nr:DUF3786 domain-containing protein [Candidatus Omnitrophota bacterium]